MYVAYSTNNPKGFRIRKIQFTEVKKNVYPREIFIYYNAKQNCKQKF